MFGKKKGDAPAKPKKEKTAKKPKKAKAMSSEGVSRFGDGGIKGLFAKHIEKAILAGVAAAALLVVFQSYGREGLDSSKDPDRLSTAINGAEQHVRASTWQRVSASRAAAPDSYEKQASSDVARVDPSNYALSQPLEPVRFGLPTKRTDPELVTLQDLEVTYGYGSLAKMPKMAMPNANRDRLSNEDGGGGISTELMEEEEKGIVRDLPDDLMGVVSRYFQKPPEAELQPARFVCLTGLIPLKEQYETYVTALRDSSGFLEERDFPKYLPRYQVERAEVRSDGQMSKWQLIFGAESKKLRSRTESSLWRTLTAFLYSPNSPPMDEKTRMDVLDPMRAWTMPLPPLVKPRSVCL